MKILVLVVVVKKHKNRAIGKFQKLFFLKAYYHTQALCKYVRNTIIKAIKPFGFCYTYMYGGGWGSRGEGGGVGGVGGVGGGLGDGGVVI